MSDSKEPVAEVKTEGKGEAKEEEKTGIYRPGRWWENYQILDVLGKGKYAKVYLTKTVDGRHCAIKFVEASKLPGFKLPALQEDCKKLQALEHAHLLRLLDHRQNIKWGKRMVLGCKVIC